MQGLWVMGERASTPDADTRERRKADHCRMHLFAIEED